MPCDAHVPEEDDGRCGSKSGGVYVVDLSVVISGVVWGMIQSVGGFWMDPPYLDCNLDWHYVRLFFL